MSFSPLNFYTFAAARGQFLRPDVQTLLREAPIGLFADLLAPHDADVRREAEALRARLDSLLFAEPLAEVDAAVSLASNVVRLRP
jgi:hypothetical protein